jgi:hypothetical protein
MSDELKKSRERFEKALGEVQEAVSAETGFWLRARRWALPLAAGAAGLAAALILRRNLPGLRRLRR